MAKGFIHINGGPPETSLVKAAGNKTTNLVWLNLPNSTNRQHSWWYERQREKTTPAMCLQSYRKTRVATFLQPVSCSINHIYSKNTSCSYTRRSWCQFLFISFRGVGWWDREQLIIKQLFNFAGYELLVTSKWFSCWFYKCWTRSNVGTRHSIQTPITLNEHYD